MTMRLLFLRGTALGGLGNDAAPGEQRDIPEPQAQALIARGRAVAIHADAAAPEVEAQKPNRKKGK